MPLFIFMDKLCEFTIFFCTQTLNLHIFAIEFSHKEYWHICGIQNGQINPIY